MISSQIPGTRVPGPRLGPLLCEQNNLSSCLSARYCILWWVTGHCVPQGATASLCHTYAHTSRVLPFSAFCFLTQLWKSHFREGAGRKSRCYDVASTGSLSWYHFIVLSWHFLFLASSGYGMNSSSPVSISPCCFRNSVQQVQPRLAGYKKRVKPKMWHSTESHCDVTEKENLAMPCQRYGSWLSDWITLGDARTWSV